MFSGLFKQFLLGNINNDTFFSSKPFSPTSIFYISLINILAFGADFELKNELIL